MFRVHLYLSLLVHVRTFFLMPFSKVPDDVKTARSFSLFANSPFGLVIRKRMCRSKGFISPNAEKPLAADEELVHHRTETVEPVSRSLKSGVFWCFVTFFAILDFRTKTINGLLNWPIFTISNKIMLSAWIYPWIEWTFSDIPASNETVSKLLNNYGYWCFSSPMWALVCGLVFVVATKTRDIQHVKQKYNASLSTVIHA